MISILYHKHVLKNSRLVMVDLFFNNEGWGNYNISEFNTNLTPTISNNTANAFFNVAAGNL